MKFLFLVNNAQFLAEFFGKISGQFLAEGDEVLVVVNSKIAEFDKRKFFSNGVRVISKVDWCMEHYDEKKGGGQGLSWRDFFPIYGRWNFCTFNFSDTKRMMLQLYQLFDYVFSDARPDAVIAETPAGLFHETAYFFCKKEKIPYIGIMESRVPGRTDFFDTESTCSRFKQTFESLKKGDLTFQETSFSRDFVEKFINHKVLMTSIGLTKIKFNPFEFLTHYLWRARKLRKVMIGYLLNRPKFKNYDYESELVLRTSLRSPWKTLIRNLKIAPQRRFFEKYKGKENEKYFFFPMQYEPEASTLVLATYNSNQLAAIKNACFTLPFPYKLFLKEHPGSIGMRSDNFYREIRKIPNAVLLGAEESVRDIIKNSAGVITCTSTAGLEGALSGKPVYLIGNVFYSHHPMCYTCLNFDDLKKRIENDLQSSRKISESELDDINIRFISSYMRNNIKADPCLASEIVDANDYALICQAIRKAVPINT